jgi:hypothetical protein
MVSRAGEQADAVAEAVTLLLQYGDDLQCGIGEVNIGRISRHGGICLMPSQVHRWPAR